jgi:hypothetical protein
MELRNLQLVIERKHGVRFQVSPVSGHNYHGLVERRFKSVQECFDKADFKQMRLHATGVQTLAKLVENDLNNHGFSYGRSADNNPLLKLVTLNMMRLGRIHNRALDGPLKLPSSPLDVGGAGLHRFLPEMGRCHGAEADKAAQVV